MKGRIMIAAACLGLAPLASAQQGPMGSVSAYATRSEAEITTPGSTLSDDGVGFGIKGWFSPNGSIFGQFEHQSTELDNRALGNADLESTRLGGGYWHQLQKGTGIYGLAEFVDLGSDIDEDGFGVHGGIWTMLTPQFGLGGSLGYLSLDDTDGFELNFGGMFQFNRTWGAFADYRLYLGEASRFDLDINDLRAGVSFSFGM